jgi:hypothetical protein
MYADVMYQLSEKLQAAVILCYQPPGMALDPETLVAVTGDDALWVRSATPAAGQGKEQAACIFLA